MKSDVSFNCRKCGSSISGTIHFSEPNFLVEELRDSDVYDQDYLVCDKCNEEHIIDITNGYYGLTLDIDGIKEEDLEFTSPEEEFSEEDLEWILEETQFLSIYNESIDSVLLILDSNLLSGKSQQVIYNMLFAQVITAMETYLSDTIKNKILNNPDATRQLIENDPTFKNRKFSLNEIYAKLDLLNDIVKNYLADLMYHNLGKIRPLYKSALGVNFPSDISKIFKAVKIRHDIVHRNGNTTEGEEIEITKEQISDLIKEVNNFIYHIDKQLARLTLD